MSSVLPLINALFFLFFFLILPPPYQHMCDSGDDTGGRSGQGHCGMDYKPDQQQHAGVVSVCLGGLLLLERFHYTSPSFNRICIESECSIRS